MVTTVKIRLLNLLSRSQDILKVDQERINSCISDSIRKNGGTHMDYKRNWVLVDKMVAELRKPV